MLESLYKQKIKSFVLRQGKITAGQLRAIELYLPKYGVNFTHRVYDLNNLFQRSNPKIIEIGFGMGTATWQIAKNNPINDYIAIEVHSPGVGALLMSINEHKLNNIRIIQYDAVEVLKNMIPDSSITGFHIYFPDPWPKKRHHKRRIIQTELVNLLIQKLIPKGYIHLATDCEDYANWMIDILNKNTSLVNYATNGGPYIVRPEFRPLTKFEQRGINLGHKIWDIMYISVPKKLYL